MSAIDVSVIVPLFNHARYLGRTHEELNDWLGRNFASFEIIFVDDGSTDDTAEVIASLLTDDSVVGLRQTPNAGQAHAVLSGLLHARGQMIVSMDADLELDLDIIRAMHQAIEEGADLVLGNRQKRVQTVWRRLGSRVAAGVVRHLYRMHMSDIGCGSSACSRAFRDRWLMDEPPRGPLKLSMLKAATRVREVSAVMRPVRARTREVSSYSAEQLVGSLFVLASAARRSPLAQRPVVHRLESLDQSS